MSDALFAEARKRAQGIVRDLRAMAERPHLTEAESATLILAAAEIDGAVDAFQGVVMAAHGAAAQVHDVLAAAGLGPTLIWSGEHKAWWRRGPKGEGAGYTTAMDQAGRWPRAEAERITRHAGPEKEIHLIPTRG